MNNPALQDTVGELVWFKNSPPFDKEGTDFRRVQRENQGWLKSALSTTPASFAKRFTTLSPPYLRRGIF